MITSVLDTQPKLSRLEVGDPRWLAFVGSHPDASPFHHPAWGRVIEECYGYQQLVLAETRFDGQVVGGLPIVEVAKPLRPRRWVSLPFVDSCRPLGLDGPGLRLGDALTDARRRSGIASVEVRAPVYGDGVYSHSAWVRHVLTLTDDLDGQFKALHQMTRRNVRTAERHGIEITMGEGMPSLTDTFYALHADTRRRLGVPVQPKRFFRALWTELMERDLGFVLVARHAGSPVAAAVFLNFNDQLVYKYGASSSRAWHLRPNNLLFWHAIRWAVEHGCRTLDFGRTDLDQQGLRSFKSGWGAVEEPLVYSYVAESTPAVRLDRSSALLGPLLRHSPVWVTRLLGQLYRFAA